MQYTTAFVLAIASLAAAQSTTTTTSSAAATGINQSGCGGAIDAIITNCLASTGLLVTGCPSNDWDCLCTNSQAVLTCYDNCPSDPRRPSAQNTKVSYCNSASAYPSSSSTSSAFSAISSGSSTSPTASSTASGDSAEASETGSSTSSGSSRASSASESAASATGGSDSGAGDLFVPAFVSGLLAAVCGFAAVL